MSNRFEIIFFQYNPHVQFDQCGLWDSVRREYLAMGSMEAMFAAKRFFEF